MAWPALGQTPVPPRTSWRNLVGRTAVDVRAVPGEVRVALAGDSGEVALVLRAAEVRRVVDTAMRRLAPRRSTSAPWSVRLEEPGVRSGALELRRNRSAKGVVWFSLFAAEDVVGGVRDSVGLAEVRVVLGALRSAAVAALPPPRRPRRPG